MNSKSYFQIYDGQDETAPLLLRHCGSTVPPVIASSGNVVLIKLFSNPLVKME